MAQGMTVTVVTDASFCPKSGVAGWCSWAESERMQTCRWGALRDTVHSPHEAEIAALANGIYTAIRDGVAQPGDVLRVQCDNQRVVDFFAKGKTPRTSSRTEFEKKAMTHIDNMRVKSSLEITVRHIKGHSGSGTMPTFVHQMVDKAARKKMRAKRDGRTNPSS
jgi:ribonuclease HI